MVVYLLVEKRRTKSWNWPHVMICPPDPVHPSLPDLVPCALETWLLWTTVTGSLALWVLNGVGCERDGKAFYRQERNEFGVFIFLASSCGVTAPLRKVWPSLSTLSRHFPPWHPWKQAGCGFGVLPAWRCCIISCWSRSYPDLCKILGTTTVILPNLSVCFLFLWIPFLTHVD